jgi:hypothetical protein
MNSIPDYDCGEKIRHEQLADDKANAIPEHPHEPHNDKSKIDKSSHGPDRSENPQSNADGRVPLPQKHRIIQNRSHFSAAIVVHERHASSVLWEGSSEFGVAVVLGDTQCCELYVSLYLPTSSTKYDDAFYEYAISCCSDLLRAIPRRYTPKRTFIGCDANAQVCQMSGWERVIGPITTGTSFTKRAELFLGLICEANACLCNTFPSSDLHYPPAGDSEPRGWTHSWLKDARVKTQIDFVACSRNTSFQTEVLYRFAHSSDHRPILLHVEGSVPSRPQLKKKSSIGWRPNSEEDVRKYLALFCELPDGASLSDIQGLLQNALTCVCATTRSQRLKAIQHLEEPQFVELLRSKMNLAETTEEKRHIGKMIYRIRRKWLPRLKQLRFQEEAMTLPRADKHLAGTASWLESATGERVFAT